MYYEGTTEQSSTFHQSQGKYEHLVREINRPVR